MLLSSYIKNRYAGRLVVLIRKDPREPSSLATKRMQEFTSLPILKLLEYDNRLHNRSL